MRAKLFLLLIIAVPLIPLMAAIFFYQNPHYLSGKLTVRGQLLQPPLDGTSFIEKSGNKNTWLLLIPVKGPCDLPCQKNLFFSRQTHVALGKNKDRLTRIMLFAEDSPPLSEKLRDELARQLPPIKVKEVSLEELTKIFDQFGNSIYVADPFGNIMLRHDRLTDTDSSKILLKDLKHLLRSSQIG